MHVNINICFNICFTGVKLDRQYWDCESACRTLVVVLAPHEDAAPMGQVI